MNERVARLISIAGAALPFAGIAAQGLLLGVNGYAILRNTDKQDSIDYASDPDHFENTLKERRRLARGFYRTTDYLCSDNFLRLASVGTAAYVAFFTSTMAPYLAGAYFASILISTALQYVLEVKSLKEIRTDATNAEISEDIVELQKIHKFIEEQAEQKPMISSEIEFRDTREEFDRSLMFDDDLKVSRDSGSPTSTESQIISAESDESSRSNRSELRREFMKKNPVTKGLLVASQIVLGMALLVPLLIQPGLISNGTLLSEFILSAVNKFLSVVRVGKIAGIIEDRQNDHNKELVKNMISLSTAADQLKNGGSDIMEQYERTKDIRASLNAIKQVYVDAIETMINKEGNQGIADKKIEEYLDSNKSKSNGSVVMENRSQMFVPQKDRNQDEMAVNSSGDEKTVNDLFKEIKDKVYKGSGHYIRDVFTVTTCSEKNQMLFNPRMIKQKLVGDGKMMTTAEKIKREQAEKMNKGKKGEEQQQLNTVTI